MRVTTHPRVMRKPWSVARSWGFVSALLGSPGLGVLVPTERHTDVAKEVIAELPWLSGNIIHDAHTAILMREHGILRICTLDADFHRFPFLDVINAF
jgi:predicted nucleic acid-binding protein